MITSLMSSIKIQGNNLPNMPWQDRPAGCNDPLWRYSANPVIPRDLLPDSNSIFNSAVVPFEGGCADTVTGLAFGYIPEIIEFTKRTNIL